MRKGEESDVIVFILTTSSIFSCVTPLESPRSLLYLSWIFASLVTWEPLHTIISFRTPAATPSPYLLRKEVPPVAKSLEILYHFLWFPYNLQIPLWAVLALNFLHITHLFLVRALTCMIITKFDGEASLLPSKCQKVFRERSRKLIERDSGLRLLCSFFFFVFK